MNPQIMIYFSFAVSVCVIAYFIYKVLSARFKIVFHKTTWRHRIIGVKIWYKRIFKKHSQSLLLYIPFCNKKKAEQKDIDNYLNSKTN